MNNPYKILGVSQEADRKEIAKAFPIAIKERKFSPQEINLAQRQLLSPATRLAADFLYPAKIQAKRLQRIELDVKVPDIDLDDIDENAFDSLK